MLVRDREIQLWKALECLISFFSLTAEPLLPAGLVTAPGQP